MENSSFSHALPALLIFIFLFLTTFMGSSLATIPNVPTKPNNNTVLKDYIKKSCNTTLYPSLCYNSLSKYSAKIQTNPKILATTALSITVSLTQSSLDSMKNLSESHRLNPRETSAMNDCFQLLGDSGDLLKTSVEKMDHIEPGPKFVYDMSDVQTWVSAALTDDDTCMDGFDEDGVRDEVEAMVRRRVSKALQLTSISLTFINNYAKC